jgi:GWxTD domain-containing protein
MSVLLKTPLRLGAMAIVFIWMAGSAVASLSPQYLAWRNGPVRWIMAPDEQRAWRALKVDEDASRFIDLFWARRDSTAGTPVNEFHDDFDQRVRYADADFQEGNKKGSMTDRGQVYIILGSPTGMQGQAGYTTQQVGGDSDSASGPDVTGNLVWTWEHADAQKFNMPRVQVVFIEKPFSDTIFRDPQRPDFFGASPVAIRKAIVNPDLKELPDWAPRGGLDPKVLRTEVVEAPTPAVVTIVTTTPVEKEPAPRPEITPGTSRLVLLHDVASIVTETDVNPFTRFTPVTLFHPSDDLGWVAQYCSVSSEEPTLRYTIRLTGKAANETINRRAGPDDLVPDRLRAVPGCYMLRGAIPLSGMSAGTYQLQVTVEDPATGRSDHVRQEFRIE